MAADPYVEELGEDAVVACLCTLLRQSPRTVVGPGDDAAVLRPSRPGQLGILKTDCVVEGVHFLAEAPARWIGHKALARCISDVGAMGGNPTEAVITLGVPTHTRLSRLLGIYRGLARTAQAFEISLVGGETTRLPAGGTLWVNVALQGTVNKSHVLTRRGARPGDGIYVTGRLGGSFPSGRHLRFTPRLREAQWLAENGLASALMDLSDGLAQDLPRLAKCSGVGFSLMESSLPRHRGCTVRQALTDGEDYELLFTCPQRLQAALDQKWLLRFPKLLLTKIGSILPLGKNRKTPLSGGWDHFRKA
jgi:thiamine-monophosphate kinase